MPPYGLIYLESLIFMFGIGLFLAIAIILARTSRFASFGLTKKSDEDLDHDVHEFGGSVKESNRPLPVFMWVTIIGYFIWAAGYVFFSGYFGL